MPLPCREMQRVWAEDSFLLAGGEQRQSRRPAMGFSQAFATIHSHEAVNHAHTLRQLSARCLDNRLGMLHQT